MEIRKESANLKVHKTNEIKSEFFEKINKIIGWVNRKV